MILRFKQWLRRKFHKRYLVFYFMKHKEGCGFGTTVIEYMNVPNLLATTEMQTKMLLEEQYEDLEISIANYKRIGMKVRR
jgi:hypothetical protein